MDTRGADRRLIGRDQPAIPIEVVSARGSRVRDRQGRSYIDFTSGWCVGNLGWNHPTVLARLRRFRGPCYVNPRQLYAPWTELAQRLLALAPRNLKRCFRTTGGTESVEVALQIAMAATGRRAFVSIEGAYHGASIAAHSIGSATEKQLPGRLPRCDKLKLPLDATALARLETRLKKCDVAAFIMEPVICNLAVTIPGDDFMRGLPALCRRYGTLLIMDEVATGFGRTGHWFGCEHWRIQPDLMCLAKALSSGHAGIGATLATTSAADALASDSAYSTYGWHPLGVEAALGSLDVYEREGEALLSNCAESSDYFRARLAAMQFAGKPEIRILGLAIGLKFGTAKAGKTLVERCRRRGLLLNDDDEGRVTLYPALNMSRATARAGLELLARCAGG